jgi:ribulose-5-phosphate 4-epimerase/fuculose-1-phosphate aldolase
MPDLSDKLNWQVCKANLALVEHGLVTFTFGNVSQIDRQSGAGGDQAQRGVTMTHCAPGIS